MSTSIAIANVRSQSESGSLMAATVGYVYAEMHRDAILSRLTSTNAGELGLDFWMKFVSAGAIPVLLHDGERQRSAP